MNSQIIQTQIKFSIKTSNLDDIHKKIDKPLSKVSYHKTTSKLSNSNDILKNNLKSEKDINSSTNFVDVSAINGVPVIKKLSMSKDSSKRDVKLKRHLEEHQEDDLVSKLRKCHDNEDTIIIEPESASKLVIHPLKTKKISDIGSSRKETETVNMSAIFKALEEKMNNIDKICNSQNSRAEFNESKPISNDTVKLVLKMSSKKPIVDSTGIFKDETELENKNHGEIKKYSKLENYQSNLKSLQESILKEQKKSKDVGKEKLKSSHRDSRDKEKKNRDSKNDNRSNHRESYKNRDRRDNHRDNYKTTDNYRNRRKSIDKSEKPKKITESKLVYTTLGEAVKSHKSNHGCVDNKGKLDLIVKDEYHDLTISESTIDLSDKVLEDSFKLHIDKQRLIKDRSKISENLKKLLDRKNSKDGMKEISEEDGKNKSAKCDFSSSNLSPSSSQCPISSLSKFILEPIGNVDKISTDSLPQISQSESSSIYPKFSPINTKPPPANSKPPIDSTLSPIDSKLSPIDSKLSPIDSKLSPIDSKLSPIDSKLSPIDSKLSSIDSKFTPIDSKFTPIDSKLSPIDSEYSQPTTSVTCDAISFSHIRPSFEEINKSPKSTSQLFVKTANISFKISPKKMQISNVFSQITDGDSELLLLLSQRQETTPKLEIIASNLCPIEPTFKVPFNIDKKSKRISSDKILNEESDSQLNNSTELIDIIPSLSIDSCQSPVITSDNNKNSSNENQLNLSNQTEIENNSYEITKQPQVISNESAPEIENLYLIKSQFTDESTETNRPKPNFESKFQLTNQTDPVQIHNSPNCLDKSKIDSQFKKRSRSCSPDRNHSKKHNSRPKSRKHSKDRSRNRKKSKNKSKSRKKSKHHSQSRKLTSDRSLSRRHSKYDSKLTNQSNNHHNNHHNYHYSRRHNSKDRFEYDSRSRNNFKSQNRSISLQKDRLLSENRHLDKYTTRNKSKDRSKSRKCSREKSEDKSSKRKCHQRNSPSRSVQSKHESRKLQSHKNTKLIEIGEIEKQFKTNSEIIILKSESCATKSLATESISGTFTDEMPSNNKTSTEINEKSIIDSDLLIKESSIIDTKINDKELSIIDTKIIDKELSIIDTKIIDKELSIIDTKIIDKELLISDPKIMDRELSLIDLKQSTKESSIIDQAIIKKELLINDQESVTSDQTSPMKESVQFNDDDHQIMNSNTIPTVSGTIPIDPRCKKETQITEYHLQNFLNRFMYNNDNYRPSERNAVNLRPPPPPPLPSIQIPTSYNNTFDQNIYLNQFQNYNFNFPNNFVNLNQYNAINTVVPQNMYNTINFQPSNAFTPTMNTYEQPSFNNQWCFPNEFRTSEVCNNYSFNSFQQQTKQEFVDSNYQDEPVINYKLHIHQKYNEVDHGSSHQSSKPLLFNSEFHETLRYNSINKKSSTSSLMNEVMDMDLVSDSSKSIDSHKVIDANDQLSDKDDLSSCGDFEYEAASPLDPFEKFPLAPKPKYEHIIETEVHSSARGKRFEYAYLKSTVCNCVPPNPDEIKLGKTACGENCFNRRIKVECNRKCPVYELCTNRRFQEQIYAPFEPFYCANGKGWGIRSTNRIYPGTFIIEYVGELIDFPEFLNRIRQKSIYNHHFIMSIQKDMYIDAGSKGNWSRFVNHSCDPNTIIERWVVNGKTRIGFFSKKIIEENEEITIDYQFQQYGMIEQKCFCNSSNCTGVMGKVNEKLQDQIKTSHIRIRKELIQKIINRSSLKDTSHVSDMITVIKEECLDRDTFYGFLEVLLRTDSETCIRTFIECGGLKVITSFLETLAWNDWPIKLIYLKCLDHFKLKKRTILSSGCTAIQVVDIWAENPRYSLKQGAEETLLEKDLEDENGENNNNENENENLEEAGQFERNNTLKFILNDSTEPLEGIEMEIQNLANNIKQYFADEKEKFYIPKLKIIHSDSLTDLNDSESKSKDSASRASSIQGDYVRSKKRKIRRRCTEVIRKLSKEEFRRLFSERHKKQIIEKTQVSTPEVSNISNIDMDSPEVFAVVKKLLSSVIIDEISRLKGSDKFATMPVEFQNLDLDKILSDLNIGGQEEILSLMNNNNDENKTSSGSSYSNSSSKSVDDYFKCDLNGIIKKSSGLPPNWNSRQAENGKLYYYNTVTKVTQWEIPVYPWDAGEGDPLAYNFGNASNYQISREDVQIMYEEYKKTYKLQRLEERRRTRLERSIQRKLNLSPGEKNKIEFSKQVFRVVKTVVKPYNTSACKVGRIQHKQDLKFLCEKFADTIIGKEVKLVANLEDLEMNANVKSKIKTYIEKYMANQGRCYKRSSKAKFKPCKKSATNDIATSNWATNSSQTIESNKQILSDVNNSPDFSP